MREELKAALTQSRGETQDGILLDLWEESADHYSPGFIAGLVFGWLLGVVSVILWAL